MSINMIDELDEWCRPMKWLERLDVRGRTIDMIEGLDE